MLNINTENIEEKIQKLLSLANSDNPYEAQAAALKAQELMLKYNIELLEANVKEDVIIEKFSFKNEERQLRRLTYHLLLASIIAENFRTKTYYGRDYICFVGFKEDAKASVALLDFLINRISYCFDRFLENQKISRPEQFSSFGASYSKYLKRQWINGFIIGLKEAFDKRKEETCFELMVVTPIEVVEKYNNLDLRNSSVHLRNEEKDIAAFKDGRKSGLSALDPRELEDSKLVTLF